MQQFSRFLHRIIQYNQFIVCLYEKRLAFLDETEAITQAGRKVHLFMLESSCIVLHRYHIIA